MLRARAVTKSYASRVLDRVDLEVRAGEVHALLGANGAGKSTFAKIVGGLVAPDGGQLMLADEPFSPRSRSAARAAGVEIVLQELTLFETLDVAENLFLDRLPRGRLGRVDRRLLERRASEALAGLGLELDPGTAVSALGVAERQLVEIAGALSRDCRLLILDEPTATLSSDAVSALFTRMDALRELGVAMLFITHRLEEVVAVADRVTVLRDGRVEAAGVSPSVGVAVLERALGLAGGVAEEPTEPRSGRRADPEPGAVKRSQPVLSVDGLTSGDRVRDVSLEVAAGQIFGIGGLVGSGRTDLLRSIYGATARDGGTVHVLGEPLPPGSVPTAVRRGLGMVPEERQSQGLFLDLSIARNLVIASLGRSARAGVVNGASESRRAEEAASMVELRMASLAQPARELSGGNQQRTMLGRWLLAESRVLLLDEPTRGVDVGARAAVHRLLRDAVTQERAALVVSSDFDELLALCDVIAIMVAGRLVATRPAGEWTKETLLECALGRVA